MADRTVKVNLTAAVSGYVSAMNAASKATRDASAATTDAKKQFADLNSSMTKVGTVVAASGALVAAGLFAVVKAAADYGAKMAQLQSLSHASAAQMKELSDAAMTQGQAYGYSASQVVDAEIELTKAGLSTSQILGGGLKSALTLAAAGQLDVAQATQISTIAMTDFGLSAKQLPAVSDELAAGADKALGSVSDLGEALSNGGQQAHNMGLSVTDTIGTLSAFANAGIIGAEAGTQLRSMFIQLQHVTPQAQEVLDKYGISIYDASGKFVGITKLAGELQDRLGGLTQAQRNAALATVFGSHAITGASVLYNLGAQGAQKWIDAVNDSGFAAEQARGKLNSLQGDAQKLAAVFQTDLIKAGSGADNSLRGVVQAATEALQVFGDLPEPIRNGAVGLGAAAAAVGVLGGATLIAIPKIVEFKAALETLNVSVASLRTGLGGLGVAAELAAPFALIGAMGGASLSLANGLAKRAATQQQYSDGSVEADVNYLLQPSQSRGRGGQSGGVGQGLKAYAAAGGAGSLTGQGASFFGDQTVKSIQNLDAAMAHMVSAGQGQKAQQIIARLGVSTKEAAVDFPAYTAAVKNADSSTKHLSATQQAAAAIARGDATALNAVWKATTALAKKNQDLESSADAALDAIQGVTDALKQNGKTLDQNTVKGRANREAVDQAAQAIEAHAAAINSDGKHAAEASVYTDRMGVSLVHTMEQFGLSKDAAEAYVGKLLGIPKNVTTEAQLRKDQAIADAEALSARLNSIFSTPITQTVLVQQGGGGGATRTSSGAFASGGRMPDIGPKGRDSFLIHAAAGEHMWTAAEVDAVGGHAAMYRMRAAVRSGSIPRYAAGGEVRTYSGSNYGGVASGGQQIVVQPVMPDTITVQDASGFRAEMKVVADQRIGRAKNRDRLTYPR